MSKRIDPTKPDNAIIGLKITVDPKFSVEELAVQLAEAMQKSYDLKNDSEIFRQQAQQELQKMRNLQQVLFTLRERKKNPPEKISRMDPYKFYDIDSIKKDISLCKERSKDFNTRASNYKTESIRQDNECIRLQKEIKSLRLKK